MSGPRTLLEKIWDQHLIRDFGDGRGLIRIDRQVLHDGTSRGAFDRLRERSLPVRRPDLTYAVVDHGVATVPHRTVSSYEPSRDRIQALQRNCVEFGVELVDIDDPRQGIVHVMAPEQGIALPGTTLVCGDSHTATCGGLGAWAWGIGTTEVFNTMAAQALIVRRPKYMRVNFSGKLSEGVTSKDMIMALIGRHGVAGGTGHAIEYAGSAIRALPVEARLTLCNMSIEFGARGGLIAPDETTFAYVEGRRYAPKGALWDAAVADWKELYSDDGARFDAEIDIDCSELKPQLTWGTTPQDLVSVDGRIPDPSTISDPDQRNTVIRALDYMGLVPGQLIEGLPIDYAFIGSCTNGRLSDLEAAARIVKGHRVAPGVHAIVVPGSTPVKRAAEAAGLDRIFLDAGFEWREAGCSMCVATNGDRVPPGMRSISTTNRNFENRQGPGARTHLANPAMVAAAALSGRVTDVRKLVLN